MFLQKENKMKKFIVIGILGLAGCSGLEDDRVRCDQLDGGTVDAGDAGCVETQIIAFPDMLVHIQR